MTTEFNLSEKEDLFSNTYNRKDVKEFIRLLKEEFKEPSYIYDDEYTKGMRNMCIRFQEIIDKIAGDKLISKNEGKEQ